MKILKFCLEVILGSLGALLIVGLMINLNVFIRVSSIESFLQ